jgi:uncharacterized protein (UPF0254 family)
MSSVATDALVSRIVALLDADITYIGIGTGAAPTVGSTTLPSESLRKLVTTLVDADTLVLDGFWDETEANGVTYTNAGAFGNGATASTGTGELDVGGAINVVKDNTQSLTVSIEILIQAVNT